MTNPQDKVNKDGEDVHIWSHRAWKYPIKYKQFYVYIHQFLITML